jgi:hypothetical protein
VVFRSLNNNGEADRESRDYRQHGERGIIDKRLLWSSPNPL